MKERNFKIRESYAKAIEVMDDKTAGQFIKGVCDYVFKGKPFEAKEQILRSNYSLIKAILDAESVDRENGKKGAAVIAEKKRQRNNQEVKVFIGAVGEPCGVKTAREFPKHNI